jgi:hypothetical protein
VQSAADILQSGARIGAIGGQHLCNPRQRSVQCAAEK